MWPPDFFKGFFFFSLPSYLFLPAPSPPPLSSENTMSHGMSKHAWPSFLWTCAAGLLLFTRPIRHPGSVTQTQWDNRPWRWLSVTFQRYFNGPIWLYRHIMWRQGNFEAEKTFNPAWTGYPLVFKAFYGSQQAKISSTISTTFSRWSGYYNLFLVERNHT